MAGTAAAAGCPNEAIRIEQGSTFLGGCRAYELVSNLSGTTGQLLKISGYQASPDGNKELFVSQIPFGDESSGSYNYYVGSRGAGGWKDALVSPVAPNEGEGSYLPLSGWGANSDLSEVVLPTNFRLDPEDENNRVDQYMRRPDGSFEWISRGSTVLDQEHSGPSAYAGMTPDGSDVFFEAKKKLEPQAAGYTSGWLLYERDREEGTTTVVSADSSGNLVSPAGAVLGGYPLGSRKVLSFSTNRNAISRDGSRVFFTSPDPEARSGEPAELYLREGDEIVEVSAPQGVVTTPLEANYEGAAADGSRVFFTTKQQLASEDTNTTEDLYEYDVAARQLKLVSVGASGNPGGRVEAIGAVSEDGSHVYFLSKAILASNKGVAAPAQPEFAEEGNFNLYVYDAGAPAVRFIAQLKSKVGFGHKMSGERNCEATADGRYFAFTTGASLSSDDEGGEDVYRYDDSTHTLTLVSVAAGQIASAGHKYSELAGIGLDSLSESQPPAHAISEDGETVFFFSEEALVPEDRNGGTQYEEGDYYEWHDGEISLVSCGCGTKEDGLVGSTAWLFDGATADGSNAFLLTRAPLVPADRDGGDYDLYDARTGGGFAEPPPPAEPPSCAAEECRGQRLGPPAPGPIGSTAVSGTGNLTPSKARRCGRGKRLVKRKGHARCVKRRRHRKHRERSGHKHLRGAKHHGKSAVRRRRRGAQRHAGQAGDDGRRAPVRTTAGGAR